MKIIERMKKKNATKTPLKVVEPPDGGWGWIVCAAAFVTQFIVLGTMNNFGILYVELYKHFGDSASATSLIGSINYGMMFFNGPIAAALSAKYGCRRISMLGSSLFSLGLVLSSFAPNIYTLYFTYGVMIGFGASLCYFSTVVAVGQYFYKRLALANGIISSGSGVGSLVMGPVMNNLLKYLGWRDTLRVYSGMLVLVFLVALFYRPINSHINPTKKEEVEEEKNVKFIDLTIFHNKAYVFWCVSLSVFILGYFVPFVHLVQYARDNGVSKDASSLLIGIMSVGSTFGRLFFGKLSDHPKVNRLYVYQLSILMMGVCNTLLPLMKTYATILCYCVVWGAFEGCYVALCAVLTADIVGRDKLSSGVGMLFGIKSIPLTGGPALAGVIYDISQSYDVAFYIAGAVCTLCCCIMFLVPLNMPERAEEVVECIDKRLENDKVDSGKLGNERRSDDSAYVSEEPSTALILRPRPQSSYLSPYRETNLVSSPSTLSVRGSLSRSTVSLAAKYFGGIPKNAKSSEFGSMTTIPIIPASGTYKSLQQLPVQGSIARLHDSEHTDDAPNESTHHTDIPVIVVSDSLIDDHHHNLTYAINEETLEALPNRETIL